MCKISANIAEGAIILHLLGQRRGSVAEMGHKVLEEGKDAALQQAAGETSAQENEKYG
jgi:hypothetical protein